MKQLLSICIPTYNRLSYLKELLTDLLPQLDVLHASGVCDSTEPQDVHVATDAGRSVHHDRHPDATADDLRGGLLVLSRTVDETAFIDRC